VDAATQVWPEEHRACLSFSFDDARPSQIGVGLPMIERLGIAATFFVLPHNVERDRQGWTDVVAGGNEIGNHTARHPCSANFSWSRHHTLEDLDLASMEIEISDADRWIIENLGVEPRVFAYPCGLTFVGRGRDTQTLVPLIAERFSAGRTFNNVVANAPLHCDLAQLNGVNSDGLTFEHLRPTLDATLEEGAWLVLGGHEIGEQGDHETTMPSTVATIVEWCRDNGVWIDTIGNVAAMVSSRQRAGQTA
jgi:peptidoglycan-N-acetylglucosamine deacetylase